MITRLIESRLPEFDNDIHAIEFFKEQFGREFKLQYQDFIDGQTITFYDYYGQSIQIYENGIVHITH